MTLSRLSLKQYGLWSLFRYATPPDIIILAISGILALCGGAGIVLMPIIYSRFASQILSPNSPTTTASTNHDIDSILYLMIYLAIGLFFSTGISTCGFIFVGSRNTSHIRSQYFLALLRQPLSFFSITGAGSCSETLTTSINAIQRGVSEKIARTIHALGMFGGAWVIAFILSWKLALMLIWSVPIGILLVLTTYKLNDKYSQPILESTAKSTGVGEEAFSSIRNIKALGAEDAVVERFNHHLKLASKAGIRQRSLMGVTLGVLVGVNYLIIALAFWQGSNLIIGGCATFRDVFVVSIVIGTALFTMIGISSHAETFVKALAASQKVYDLIDRVAILDASSEGGKGLGTVEGTIEMRNVRHAYPSRPGTIVLQDIDLIFPPGKMTALVGSSGCGKSSIVDLIERFHDPIGGSVLLDGHDLTSLNLGWLRQKIGIVNQHPGLFTVSIFDNIAYGLLNQQNWGQNHGSGDPNQRASVEQAAKAADAHEFIMRLPAQYDTIIGNTSLSGGQRQRIAIARALVSSPKILVLDEATSAVDTESEKRIMEALNQNAAARTTIVIAHRLNTTVAADKIIVLDKGKVVEEGTHGHLLLKRGAYFDLVQAGELREEEESTAAAVDEMSEDPVELCAKEYQSHHSAPAMEKVQEKEVNGSMPVVELTPSDEDSTWTLTKFIMSFNAHDAYPNIIGFVASVIMSIEEAVNAIFLGEAVIALALPVTDPNLLSRVGFWSLMFMTLAIVQIFAFITQGVSLSISSERMLQRLKTDTFRHILRQDIAVFDRGKTPVGTMLNLLSSETVNMCSLSGSTLGLLLAASLTLGACFVVACIFEWKLALVVTATIPIILCCTFVDISLLRKFQDKTNLSLKVAASDAVEAIAEIKTVALLGMERYSWNKYNESLHALSKEMLVNSAKFALLYGASQALPFLCMALGFWYGNTLLTSNEIEPLQFFVAYSAITFGARSAGATFSFAEETSAALQAARSLKALWNRIPDIDPWSSSGRVLDHLKGSIEMRNVSFHYEGHKHQVLDNINLRIKSGDHVALVGPSGSGKSTVLALLERFYNPTSGDIFIDGIDVKDIQLKNYRSFLALVSQDIALYDGTILENIKLGVPAALATDEAIESALIASNLRDFVSSLPEGLSTRLGTKGGLLSGGQKQRLSIARALLRNPRIILLDESTSALDATSEGVILESLRKERGKRTIITVAHRLNTVMAADRIYVLEHGKIVEEGKHAELVVKKGRYWDLVSGQMRTS